MNNEQQETIVISLGGSLVVPEEVDTEFLRLFREMIARFVAEGKRFMIVVGGGRTCRKYQNVAKELTETTKEDLDWIGIYALRLNSKLLQTVCKELAYGEVVNRPEELDGIDAKVIMGGAYAPGSSSDLDAVEFAEKLHAMKIVNLSNIDFAYDKDPKQHGDAKPIKDITWGEYRKLIPMEWDPGLHAPFDPVASARAEAIGIEVAILNGKNIENVEKYLRGEEFVGTVIHSPYAI
ncbi:MAG: uridylate kinase [Parcubacteria group bacterium Gr01-1014_48]|nr:MAG: uridylate kinase [Parcubacteria group bacterium Greene0416_14]TSC71786.1 MAG: uridylate kinase [Parcubacteria group bacterium Gr01-1014_48]TSD00573.1 MAG: uridylate kinase [Parcubacteria group bacterium Greene1014_15]TSD08266.1 MAG: uridylate kinase [Parcubacteria group bacterium Greene0714_4]